ncbi:MAG: 50S ribosomal protein L7 [Eubacteriales bacterium]|nr:50S ribosomal protein L7 [Eubacteriales bacterium]
MNKALQYLGIARKAGFLETGADNCGKAVRAGKVRLLMLASDASDNARRRAESFVFGRRTPFVILPATKEELTAITGRVGCTVLAFTDIGLARHFADALAQENMQYAGLAADLAEKEAKMQQRGSDKRVCGKNRGQGKRRNRV